MISTPPSTPRALWILARMGARRWANRLLAFLRRRKKRDGAARRGATPRKGRASIVLVLVAVAFFFSALSMAARLVANLATAIQQGAAESGPIQVSLSTYFLLELRHEPAPPTAPGPEGERLLAEYHRRREAHVREVLLGEARKQAKDRKQDPESLADAWMAVYRERGIGGFQRTRDRPVFWPTRAMWPRGVRGAAMARGIGTTERQASTSKRRPQRTPNTARMPRGVPTVREIASGLT